MTPHYLLASAFVVSATAGLSSLLRTSDPLTWRGILATGLFSGIVGLTISLGLYSRYSQVDPYFLLSLCSLATLGGPQAVDGIVKGMQRAWLVFKKLPSENGNGS